MKKNLSAFIAIIACVLLAFNSIKIISLQEELDRLRSDVNDQYIRTQNYWYSVKNPSRPPVEMSE